MTSVAHIMKVLFKLSLCRNIKSRWNRHGMGVTTVATGAQVFVSDGTIFGIVQTQTWLYIRIVCAIVPLMYIVVVEEAVDGGLEVGDGSEDAALKASSDQDGEESLDGVEPGV